MLGFQELYKMYPYQKRFCGPQISKMSLVSIRHLAWSLGFPMPKAVDQVVGLLPSLFSPVRKPVYW
jgi:hypothetical protein